MIHKYTDEQKEFIKNNVEGTPSNDLANMFNKKFGTNLEVRKIRAFMNNHKLNNGVNTCFKKGQSPLNKGKKWDEYMPTHSRKKCKETTYKKGDEPINTKPIGSEYIDKDGYLYIKTKASGKRFGRDGMWQKYHYLVWMQYYGEVPRNHIVMFLDQDKTNFDIDNLILVNRSELLIINKNKLFTKNGDVNKSAVILAKLLDKQNKLKKKKYDNNKKSK